MQERELARFSAFAADFPLPAWEGESCEDSSGNYIRHTRLCRDCFFVSESESCDSCIGVVRAKDCIVQASYGDGAELVYQSSGVGDAAYDIRFSVECWMNVSRLEYCMFTTTGCQDCFGCVSLRRKRHCILNRQYTPAEYADLLPRVRRHMASTGEYGHFFPAALSPHAYNRSWADHFMPLAKTEALAGGFRWAGEAETASSGSTPPDHIGQADDSILERTLCCRLTRKPFRLVRAELDFYRRMKLAPPAVAPLERIKQRSVFFNISLPAAQTCTLCGAAMLSAERRGKAACKSCFERLQ